VKKDDRNSDILRNVSSK